MGRGEVVVLSYFSESGDDHYLTLEMKMPVLEHWPHIKKDYDLFFVTG